MCRSMTAYGKGSVITSWGSFQVELHSVNRKHLEVKTFLPNMFLEMDAFVRKWLRERVYRGAVTIWVRACFEQATPIHLSLNKGYAQEVVRAWKELAALLGQQEVPFDALARDPDLFIKEQTLPLDYERELEQALELAFASFLQTKLEEGQLLKASFEPLLSRLEAIAIEIESLHKEAVPKFRQKLYDQVAGVLPSLSQQDERLWKEVVFFAEKIDIAEEVTRFRHHLSQFKKLIRGQKPSQGKEMDFLLQELGREINTMGAKTPLVEASEKIVEAKVAIEQLREQVQNIE